MSEPNPPRRPLATFLRTAPGADAAPADATGHAAPQLLQEGEAADDDQDTAAPLAPHEEPVARADADADADRAESDTVDATVASEAPSFLGMRPRARPSPRWHWALVAGLALLLVLQSVLADRARLAADAGHRPWISALCGVLRCSLPAWREPTAFTMTSREIRPLPGQAGVLQVQASIRNDARWAQAWPDLRLSLSDADGRLIGSGVFTPAQYLGEAPAATLEPGQSARVAFRVQEPAASTVAFTFEFL
ncbi:DUF3426 domain-containing protein [Stenotrophomonas sp. ZAC14D2_NAIMI4_6]|uniref:DUF3426 domain-containing protein n=1 Tax=Stenotrophomonas sp. ZAC14D2_NAIMI4_6 TaxID=2072406 RepID=UPI000D53D973|nr:DUF3426 domain-containing protein [Stenotrophomonas sp. ZAC14D2_NAIMI4_6]AWH22957.1 DUF3426 domain-containing protein [Stenotrophomonas sp. ZAC14D2_NAIMI4_6]